MSGQGINFKIILKNVVSWPLFSTRLLDSAGYLNSLALDPSTCKYLKSPNNTIDIGLQSRQLRVDRMFLLFKIFMKTKLSLTTNH